MRTVRTNIARLNPRRKMQAGARSYEHPSRPECGARCGRVRIGVDADGLTRDADAAPPEAMLNLLSGHKAEVIALLRTGSGGGAGEDWRALYDERAAIAESDGGVPRASVEDRLNHDCSHYRKIH